MDHNEVIELIVNMESQQNRLAWLDILKGMAIIFVVLGHLPCVGGRESAYNSLVYSFHMHLFFASVVFWAV